MIKIFARFYFSRTACFKMTVPIMNSIILNDNQIKVINY